MSVSALGAQFSVHTQHLVGDEVETRTAGFDDFDAARAHGAAINPDVDGSMVPNVDESLAEHPNYEKGLFWEGNRYGVITGPNRRDG